MQTVDQQQAGRGLEGGGAGGSQVGGLAPTYTHVHCHVRLVQSDIRFNGAGQLQLQFHSMCSRHLN